MPFDPLKFMIDAVKTAVGNIASLKTQTKTNCVSAINEVSDQIGDVTLPTTAQTLTGAITENYNHIAALGPINNLTSNSTKAALSAAQGNVLRSKLTYNAKTYVAGPLLVYNNDFQKTLSNAFKAFIVNNDIGGTTTSILIHGFAYGTNTNVPSGFTGNFAFIALLFNGITTGIRIINFEQMLSGEVTYNPD